MIEIESQRFTLDFYKKIVYIDVKDSYLFGLCEMNGKVEEKRSISGVDGAHPKQNAVNYMLIASSKEILIVNSGKVKLYNSVSVYVGAVLLHNREAGWHRKVN